MTKQGFFKSDYNCANICKLHEGNYIYLLLYKDDMFIASQSKVETGRPKFQFLKELVTKDLYAPKKILGMQIRKESSNGKLLLDLG